jgi:hypothetical protein
MRFKRTFICLLFTLICLSSQTIAQSQDKLNVTGKLTRVMAIGGESTGWAIQFDADISVGGKTLHSIEVDGPADKFAKLENKQVRAKGTLTHRQGVETGDRPLLHVSSIKEIKSKA